MNLTEIKQIIAQVIAEAKEKGALPKSGGKLVHLKKELASLKSMQESVSQLTMNEANAQPMTAEYSHMQKYVNELEKIKMASAKLSEMLGNQISEVENKIMTETQKIKEMMGLVEPAPKKEAKAKPAKAEKGEEKVKEDLDEARFEKGEDVGKPGAGFAKVAKAVEKEYGSKKAGQKVAGAVLKKVLAKKK